jgi:hypothetical protein
VRSQYDSPHLCYLSHSPLTTCPLYLNILHSTSSKSSEKSNFSYK